MHRLVRKFSPIVASLALAASVLLPGGVAQAAKPGANGLIAYTYRTDAGWEIRVTNPDGTGDRRLIPDEGQDTFGPAWAPSGNRIAFFHGPCCSWDVWVANSDGSGLKNLTNNGHASYPSWSPTGKEIAFEDWGTGDHEIFAMNSDGTNPHNLTNTPSSDDGSPSWSPDGSRIAFNATRDGNIEIYVMNADGSNQTRLTNNSGTDAYANWSPDGQRIVFESDRDGNHNIYVMDADGSNQVRLTDDPGYDEEPSWSPDGNRILFTSYRTGIDQVYTMNTDGSDQTQISHNGADSTWSNWRPMPSSDKTVAVSDSGFSPKNLSVSQIKNVIEWNFAGTTPHAIVDGSGMGYFGSGNEPPGGAYAAGFPTAGTYLVLDPTTLATGTVSVPVKAKPSSGPPGTTFTITWSYAVPRPGFVFDVQIKTPGSASWVYLEHGITFKKTSVSPTDPGKYLFRSRLRSGSAHSGWSPKASVTVQGSVQVARVN